MIRAILVTAAALAGCSADRTSSEQAPQAEAVLGGSRGTPPAYVAATPGSNEQVVTFGGVEAVPIRLSRVTTVAERGGGR